MEEPVSMAQDVTVLEPVVKTPIISREVADDLVKGIWGENPVFRLVLGICSFLAVSSTVVNGIGMGIAGSFVLIASNVMISALRSVIPDKVRIPCYIIVIASFVTITDLVMAAYTPELSDALGIFIPLIVVNCIIFARAEAFAGKNGIIRSLGDGIGMGIGYTLSLVVIGITRELLGAGSLLGINVLGESFPKFIVMAFPAGGFIVFGLLLAAFNKLDESRKKRAEPHCSV
ncbi:MAG TPA: electron transport complex subunit E [Nitrospiria bacterium]|nr:electron transport complex subunit E [Nitrospiria bacterium]